jgi:thiamine pyrophosphate-dependent acetolactate synthase large subunit-like protein
MKGYAAIPAVLQAHDVDMVFAMLGGTNVAWVAEGVRTGAFRLFKTRHEETAVVAAGAYGMASGGVGVCTVTRGPGFANAINALVAATATHTPIVLVVGASPSQEPDSALNLDQEEACALIGTGFHHARDASALPGAIADAIALARRDGTPQVVSTSDDSLAGDVADVAFAPRARSSLHPREEQVESAARALAGAERPLILAGRGAVLADCRTELVELADLLGACVANSLLATAYFAGHPRNLGLSGGWGAPLAHETLQQADVVLAVGASMNDFTCDFGSLYADANVIRCDVDTDADLVGDAKATAQALLAALPPVSRPPTRWDAPTQEEIRDSVRAPQLGHSPERGLDPRVVYTMLDEKLPADRIVATDSGRSFGTCPLLVGARDARSWLVGRGYGTIGHGLGTAIGAAAACPERQVVLFTGDGGFMLASHDLDSVRLGGIDNLTVVVMNDEQLGSEIRHLQKYDLPMDVIAQPLPDVHALAQAYGGHGATVATVAELEAVELPRRGFYILDVRIDSIVDVRRALAGTHL